MKFPVVAYPSRAATLPAVRQLGSEFPIQLGGELPIQLGGELGSSSGTSSGSGSSSGPLDATVDDTSSGDDGPASDPNCAQNDFSQKTFVNLAPPMLAALDRNHSDPLLADAGVSAPAGWKFYKIDGAICRDGSPNGIFVRYSSNAATSSKLMIYLEGGGACFSPHFCDHNPANINEMFSGGANVQGEAFNALLSDNLQSPPVAQLPWDKGIFDFTKSENPFNGWTRSTSPTAPGTSTSVRTTAGRWPPR